MGTRSQLYYYVITVYGNHPIHMMEWQIQDFPEMGANHKGGGAKLIIWPSFSRNCTKLKVIGPKGRSWYPHPLDPIMISINLIGLVADAMWHYILLIPKTFILNY